MVDGSITSGGGGRELSELNDLSTTLLDAGSELILDPGGVDESRSVGTSDLGVSDIGVHGGRVVSPDGHLLDVSHLGVSLESKLSESSVVVKTGHSGEAGSGKIGGVVLADKRVGVGGVADDDGLAVAGSVVVNGLADIDEDSAIVLEKVSTLHTWATGLGTNEEVVVDILEGSSKVRGDNDFIEKGEGAIVELSLDTTKDLLLEGQVEQVKDHTLVFAEEFTTRQREQELC